MRRREGVAVIAVLLASRVGRQRSEMVIEGQLPGWTEDKLLRHAFFEGVRHDKPASEVQRVSLESTTSHRAFPALSSSPRRLRQLGRNERQSERPNTTGAL